MRNDKNEAPVTRRKRKAIRKDDYLAAALSLLLSYEERTALRRTKVPASAVLRMFSPDHIELHALGGSDAWHNLHPTLRAPHKEKSKRDTSIVAKVKRIQARHAPQKAAGKRSPAPPAKTRPARKIASRGFLRAPPGRCWKATPPRDIWADVEGR